MYFSTWGLKSLPNVVDYHLHTLCHTLLEPFIFHLTSPSVWDLLAGRPLGLTYECTKSKTVAVSLGYDTRFGKGLVMGYADYKHSLVLVETSKQFQS